MAKIILPSDSARGNTPPSHGLEQSSQRALQGGVVVGGGGRCDIRLYPDPILRRKAQPISPTGVSAQMTVNALRATFAPGMLGLAAPQIGYPYRVIAVEEKGECRIFINPVVVKRSPNLVRGPEACLSLPFVLVELERPAWIVFEGTDPDHGEVKYYAEGRQAAVILHEIDHLDGILIIDHLSKQDRRRVLEEAKRLRQKAPQPPRIILPRA